VNPDHAIGVGFSDMVQFVKVGSDEIGPALAQDTEDFGGLHPHSIITVAQQFSEHRHMLLIASGYANPISPSIQSAFA